MPRESCATPVAELFWRFDPDELRIAASGKPVTGLAQKTFFDASLELHLGDHQWASAAAISDGTWRFASIRSPLEHPSQFPARSAAPRSRSLELDVLTGQAAWRQDNSLGRFDHGVTALAYGANRTRKPARSRHQKPKF
jgi:hypothetical protein